MMIRIEIPCVNYKPFYITRRLRKYKFRQIHFGFKIAVGATILLYLFIPFLFHFSISIQQHLVFLPFGELINRIYICET